MKKTGQKILGCIMVIIMIVGMTGMVNGLQDAMARSYLKGGYTSLGYYGGNLGFCQDEVEAELNTSPYSSSEPMYTRIELYMKGYSVYPNTSAVREGWDSSYYHNPNIAASSATCKYYVDYVLMDTLTLTV